MGLVFEKSVSICLAGISQLRGNCKWEEERRDAPSFERFLVEIIEFSLRNFLPRNIHGIIRNRFRKWRKRKWKKREFCSRFWDQIFLIFSFPRRTGMKRGLPAVSTRSRSVATFRGSAMRWSDEIVRFVRLANNLPVTRFVVNNPMTPW